MADTSLPQDRWWTTEHLALYMGYSESTIQKWASKKPHCLPPRVTTTPDLRWEPSVCLDWSRRNSGAANDQTPAPAKVGRRRIR